MDGREPSGHWAHREDLARVVDDKSGPRRRDRVQIEILIEPALQPPLTVDLDNLCRDLAPLITIPDIGEDECDPRREVWKKLGWRGLRIEEVLQSIDDTLDADVLMVAM